jgi:two-component system response regulator WspF
MNVAIASHDGVLVDALRAVIASAPQHQLLWVAHNGTDAVRRCEAHRPDVLLMCLAMPGMDTVDATRAIMAATPCGIIIVSTSADGDTAPVFAAMGAGALDVVSVPSASQKKGRAHTAHILQRIRLAGMLAPPPSALAPAPSPLTPRPHIALVAIGASAGGPPAVAEVLRELPATLRAAVVVVQHIDARFTESMATWLGTQTALQVRIARHHEYLEAGVVYLAAGEHHLVVSKEGTLAYTMEPRRTPYRPSADVLLDSVARNWRATAIGIILSGMGSDGAVGLRRLRDTGARTIAQDRLTSAVYGMPRAAAELDATTDVLPLSAIGPLVRQLLHPQAGRREPVREPAVRP